MSPDLAVCYRPLRDGLLLSSNSRYGGIHQLGRTFGEQVLLNISLRERRFLGLVLRWYIYFSR